MKKQMGISDETVGIKDHSERDMPAMESGDLKYLGGQDPGEYSEKQNNELARNLRKHRAP